MSQNPIAETPSASAHDLIQAAMAALGLSVTAEFVPWSQSRNKDEKATSPNTGEPNPKFPRRSLNWRVTVKRNGRDALTTDYSAGIAHCPAYKSKHYGARPGFMNIDRDAAVTRECETGFASRDFGSLMAKGAPILPDPVDVLASLVRDSDVLDAGGFENWAGDLGYDTDSRSAEAIYRACLDVSLKLRSALGEAGLAKLREASADW